MDPKRLSQGLLKRHPLQRMQSPSRGFSFLVHSLSLVSFASCYKHLIDYPNPINESYGWHFQYLTIIGLTLATVTFAFGILADISLSPTLFRVKNILSIISTPLEVLVSILYWGLRSISKDLVIPPWAQIDLNADIRFHAVPSLALALDLLVLSPPWTITAVPSLAISSLLAVAYWAWIERCWERNQYYPYPIFAEVNTYGRAGLFAASAVIMSATTTGLSWAYARMNGVEFEEGGDARPSQADGVGKRK